MPRAKVDKEKELKAKAEAEVAQLKHAAEAKISEVKIASDRAVKRKNRKLRQQKLIMLGMGLVIVAALIGGGLAYKNVKDENARLSNPQESAKLETDKLKKQVAALIDVPTDEEPTIANVSDAAKAKEQSATFFANAQDNDRLFLYTKAKKAILYRPSTNKIVEVSTLNIGTGQNGTTPQQGTQQPTTPAGTEPTSTPTPAP